MNEHLFRELEFLVENVDVAGKESLTTSRSRQRFNSFRIPEHVLVVNYLGVPLTGSMSLWAHRGFSILSKYGPNDGVALLADMILPRSVTLADLGNDHFMRAKPLDLVTVALTTTVIRWLEWRIRAVRWSEVDASRSRFRSLASRHLHFTCVPGASSRLWNLSAG